MSRPISVCGKLIPKVMLFGGGAFGRWLGHKGGVIMNVINVLLKKTPGRSPSLLPCKDTARSQCLQPEKVSPEPDRAGTLISNFRPPELWKISTCLQATMSRMLCYSGPSILSCFLTSAKPKAPAVNILKIFPASHVRIYLRYIFYGGISGLKRIKIFSFSWSYQTILQNTFHQFIIPPATCEFLLLYILSNTLYCKSNNF